MSIKPYAALEGAGQFLTHFPPIPQLPTPQRIDLTGAPFDPQESIAQRPLQPPEAQSVAAASNRTSGRKRKVSKEGNSKSKISKTTKVFSKTTEETLWNKISEQEKTLKKSNDLLGSSKEDLLTCQREKELYKLTLGAAGTALRMLTHERDVLARTIQVLIKTNEVLMKSNRGLV